MNRDARIRGIELMADDGFSDAEIALTFAVSEVYVRKVRGIPRLVLVGQPPQRTEDERLDALKLANAARSAKAQFKRRVRNRDIDWGDVVLGAGCAWDMESMLAAELLHAVRGIGPKKLRRIFSDARVSQRKTLGGLTTRQRRDLVRAGVYHAPGSFVVQRVLQGGGFKEAA